MNVLVVYAHPREDSFNHSILQRAEGVLAELQQEVRVRNLYADGFDPLLSAEDQKLMAEGKIPSAIQEEQDQITWADCLIIIHPIWWFGMPAIMKGYIDRIFVSGFAYKYEEGILRGLLDNKKLILINTTGTPDKIMNREGIKMVLETTMDKGVYEFCGFEVEHLYLPGVPYVKKSTREEYLDQVENLLWQEFN